MYGPGPALVSSGAGALPRKCPRGPRGSQGAGDSRVGPPLARSPTSRAPRVAAAGLSFVSFVSERERGLSSTLRELLGYAHAVAVMVGSHGARLRGCLVKIVGE
jgi:hypothetical protein